MTSQRPTAWCILGTGPFGLEVYDWARDCEALRVLDFIGFLGDPAGAAPSQSGLPALDEATVTFHAGLRVVNAIADCDVKQKVAAKLATAGAIFETVVHPSSVVRAREIGRGTLIAPGCVIGSQARIGELATINYQCGIGHEADIGAYATLSPGVQIGGRTTLGAGSFVGLSATVIDNVRVGTNARITAGAVVISRVADGATMMGNPARKVQLG